MTIPPEILESIAKESLSIEVTTRCTSNCSHCFARAGRSEFPELDRETVLSVLREGCAIGFRHLHLTGGEPLLWEPLFDVLGEARSMGYETIFLNTNGTLIDENSARRLAHIDALTLSVSLQGPVDHHDAVRGSGSHAGASRGIDAALEAGLPVHLFCVTGKSLLPELPRFVEGVYRDHPGIKDITLIQLIRVPGDALDISSELLGPDDFLTMVRMASLLNLYGLAVSLLENPLATAAARLSGTPWLPAAPSLFRPGKLIIMADRSITLAHSSRESLGLYAPEELRRVLASEPYLCAVGEDAQTCPECPHITACREGGLMRPSEPFRDMVEDVPYCRRVLDLVNMRNEG